MTSQPTNFQCLLVATTAEGVRTITINRPDRLNAVNDELAKELPDAVHAAGVDDAVRVVVITGAGTESLAERLGTARSSIDAAGSQ